MASEKIAHLEMIQNIVNRLSQNSFLLKGWTVILVSGLLALGAARTETVLDYLALFPVLAFWGLDAYFLREEKTFRHLFNHVREIDEKDIDFSMDRSVVADKRESVVRVAVSKTLLVFHGVLLVAVVTVAFFALINNGEGI